MLCPLFSHDHYLEQTSLALTVMTTHTRKVLYKVLQLSELVLQYYFIILFFFNAFCVKKRAFSSSLILEQRQAISLFRIRLLVCFFYIENLD